MEKLWAVMIQKIKGLDSTVEQVINKDQEELISIWNHQQHGEDLHITWKESKILAELEKLLAQLDQSASNELKRKRDTTDNGLPNHWQTEALPEPDPISARYQVTSLDLSGPNPSYLQTSSLAEDSSLREGANLPESAPNLLNHYFQYTHCWFPILNRPNTLRKLYEYRRPPRPTQPTSADLALLWAICAYSQQQMSRSVANAIQNEEVNVAIKQMRQTARSLIPAETEILESGHVQAILLIVLLDMGTASWSSAWLLVGLAVRILLDKIESLDNPTRGWLAMLQGCFVLDTLIAARLERPPHLQSCHLERTNFLDEDGHEEWEPWLPGGNEANQSREPAFTISCFNRLTDLCMIVNLACLQQPSPTAADRAVMEAYQIAQRFPFPIMTVEQRPPHQMLLQATYFATLVKISHLTNESQTVPRWRYLETLEHFDNTWGRPDQCGIPSLVASLCYLVSSKWDHPRDNATPQAKANFCRRLGDVLLRLSDTWPDFKNASNINMLSQSIMSDQRGASQPHPGSQLAVQYDPPSGTNYMLQRGQTTGVWPSQASLFDDDLSSARMDLSTSGRPTTILGQDMPLTNPFASGPTFDQAPMDFGSMNVDVSASGNRPLPERALSHKASSTGGMATSPSFNGDEIDALFHEMAELDTTQWSLDRSQALKDFGFSDDTTFEAFCNDPDRLMLSDAYMGPFGQGQKGVTGLGVDESLMSGNASSSVQTQTQTQTQSGYGQSYDIDIVGNAWAS